MGYSLWGHKESVMTEHTHTQMINNIFISVWYTAKWLRYTHIFHVLSYYDLLQGTEYTSLCYMIGPCLSILVKKHPNPTLPCHSPRQPQAGIFPFYR